MNKRQMTSNKLTKLFIAADKIQRDFFLEEGPHCLPNVSHNLFNDFVTAAKNNLRDSRLLTGEVARLLHARYANRAKENDTPLVTERQNQAIKICAAALEVHIK